MTNENKYFSINKKSDFSNGFNSNGIYDDFHFSINTDLSNKAYFISASIDSCINGNIWHRAKIDIDLPEGTLAKINFYASDKKTANLSNNVSDLDFYIAETLPQKDNIYLEENLILSEIFKGEDYKNSPDILLHSYVGRFLWVKIELLAFGDISPVIKKIRIYYTAHSFIRYLPEIYQQENGMDSFLDRFIAIFQEIYIDIDERISKFPSFLDIDNASNETLSIIINWLKLDDFSDLPTDMLKKLANQAFKQYKVWGTKIGISDIIELIWGEKPYIIEYFQIKKHFQTGGEEDFLRSRYCDSPFTFAVLLPYKEGYENTKLLDLIKKALNNMKPAYTNYRLIVLENKIVLNSYTYLGINSKIADYKKPLLDGKTVLSVLQVW